MAHGVPSRRALFVEPYSYRAISLWLHPGVSAVIIAVEWTAHTEEVFLGLLRRR
jgi:hypothetical protein